MSFNYLETSPLIDGFYDQAWDVQEFEDISTIITGELSAEGDLTGMFKAGWTDDTIYVYAVIKDDVFHSDTDSKVSDDDALEIYFDINNDKENSYGSDDFRYQLRYNDASLYEVAHDQTENIRFIQRESNDSLFYEFAFPMSELGLTDPINGLTLGFDIQFNDDDDGGARDTWVSWFSQFAVCIYRPAYFGTVKLDGRPEAEKASKPDFSAKRGIYKEAFTLSISSELSGAEIYYTLDGSNPVFSATRLQGVAPVSVSIDPNDATNRGGQTPGVIVRAACLADGYSASEIATHSYIFLNEVLVQDDPGGMWNDPVQTFDWPGYTSPQSIGYNMNQVITLSDEYGDLMDEALLDIPTYSLVTDYGDLFDEVSGLYMNALNDGWECPVSVELIDPRENEDFQADAALRMRGRYSRLPRNPKHSFRLLFKGSYGDPKLDYPVFGNKGLDEYDHLDFRTAQNSSWQIEESHNTVTFLKEIYTRDVQEEMGYDHTLSHYCHLYLNGMYWGLYQIQERADKKFAEAYMGSDEDDYDVVKPQKDVKNPEDDLLIGVADGNLDAAGRLWDAMIAGFETNEDYFRVQGMNADGTANPSYETLLDVENLIDYLLISFYTGSEDGPGVTWEGLWGNMVRPNNFIAIYNHSFPDGFKWIVHDMEKCMYGKNDNKYINGLNDSWYSHDFSAFNPLTIHRELLKNDEYRIHFTDRVNKYFMDEGLLSPEVVSEMFAQRKAEIDIPVIAEASRWSWWTYLYDDNTAPTRQDWENNVNALFNDYFPYRTDIVLNLLASIGIEISLTSPYLEENGIALRDEDEKIDAGSSLSVAHANSQGSVYYTINGDDPRAIGGAVGATATVAASGSLLTVSHGMSFKARVKDGDAWSPLYEIRLDVEREMPNLKITEVHYHPAEDSAVERPGDLEFIELKNIGATAIDLSGFAFVDGLSIILDALTIEPGNFAVLASDSASFRNRYGFDAHACFEGKLSNDGEKIVLHDASGSTVLDFRYADNNDWPALADGFGFSLVPDEAAVGFDPDDDEYWRSSTNRHGSPNADDPLSGILPVLISEVLSHTEDPLLDQIELYNPNSSSVNIGNWYLSDNREIPMKWEIPEATQVPAEGYLNIDADEFGTAFLLSSEGEEVCLSSANAAGDFTGYSTHIDFGASDPDISFGEFTNRVGSSFFVSQADNTPGEANAYPMVGPVVISEIMYHPLDEQYEYLKLQNASSESVSLFLEDLPEETWKISGIDFDFPEDVELQTGEFVYVIEAEVEPEDFKLSYGIGDDVQIFNMNGGISNGGESISLWKPALPEDLNRIVTPDYILVERVKFDDEFPWSSEADGTGYALSRIDNAEFANDPEAWGVELPNSLFEPAESYAMGELNVYPNPTDGALHIVLDAQLNTQVSIRDISGRLMYLAPVTEDKMFVDLSGYKEGVYLLTVTGTEGIVTRKIVKE